MSGPGIDLTGVGSSSWAINNLIYRNPGATFSAVPGATYRLDDPVVVYDDRTTLDFGTATVEQSMTGRPAIKVFADHVSILGGTIMGPQFATYAAAEHGVHVVGRSADHPVRNFTISGTSVSSFGGIGIHLDHVVGFAVNDVTVTDCWFGGITGLSCLDGEVNTPTVARINADGVQNTNAYGISWSARETGNLATDPRSENITVRSPTVTDCEVWTALDTHGGVGIRYLDIDVRRCWWPVGIVTLEGPGNVPLYPPTDFEVTGVIDSERTDATTFRAAIVVDGVASTAETRPDDSTLATGTLDVTVRGHGGDLGGAAVILKSTLGVMANVVSERCSPNALYLSRDNYEFNVEVTAIDTWSWSAVATYAAYVGAHNQGSLTATDSVSDSPPSGAVSLNTHGVRATGAGTIVELVAQSSEATTPLTVDAPAQVI